ncbi:hypothetical protein SMICM17S_00825 [Streptomyces microflavus]
MTALTTTTSSSGAAAEVRTALRAAGLNVGATAARGPCRSDPRTGDAGVGAAVRTGPSAP